MLIYRLRASIALIALTALTSLFLRFLPAASAAVEGKTQAITSSYPIDGAVVASSVGIYKKNPSGRLNVPATFVPYYFLAVNKGAGGLAITPSDYYATLAYTLKAPDGKDVDLTKNFQDVVGSGPVINQDAAKRVIQPDSSNGTEVTFMPNQTGTYTLTLWHDYNEDEKLNIGEPSATATFVISYDYTPSVSYVNYGSAPGGLIDKSYGILTRVCIVNNFQYAGLDSNEGFTVTSSSATEVFDAVSKWKDGAFGMNDDANSNTYTLTRENFGPIGCAYLNHYNSADTPLPSRTVTLTFTGFGPTFGGKYFTVSSTYIDATNYPIAPPAARTVTNLNNLSGSYVSPNTATAPALPAITPFVINTPVGTSATVTLSSNAGANKTLLFRVVDTDGKITGLKGATYSGASATAAGAVTFAQSAQLNRNESYMIYVQGTKQLDGNNLDGQGTVAVQIVPQDRYAKYMVGYPTTIRTKPGETTTAYLQVKDQFGVLLPKGIIVPSVTGRNATDNLNRAYQADTYGRIQWTLKDNAENNFQFTDVVTGKDIYGENLVGSGLLIHYGPYLPVANIKIKGAASEDTIRDFTKSYIDTSYSGASNTTVKMSATLYDANGGTLPAGVKVTWSTKGLDGKVFIPTDTVSGTDYTTTYTDASGIADTYVYSLATGDVEVYATVDGVTSAIPGKIHFANAPADVRIVSATTSEGWIKAHVEDRYGNPIEGVDLTFSRVSGKGYIPSRSITRINALTDKDGNLEIAVTGGDATFEVATTTDYFGQTGSDVGYVNGIAVSASSAGGSLANLGVGKVRIDVKSRDLVGETLAATEIAIAAADKSNAASNIAAEKADNAMLKAEEVNQQILDISDSVIEATKTFNKSLKSLYSTLLKIQKKIG